MNIQFLRGKYQSKQELTKAFRRKALELHPDTANGDKGAAKANFQALNAEYEYLKELIAKRGQVNTTEEQSPRDISENLAAALQVARQAKPLDIEIVGQWIWLTFNGKPSDETRLLLKNSGFRWAAKKRKWYFAGVPAKSSRGRMSYSDIKDKYGAQKVSLNEEKQLA